MGYYLDDVKLDLNEGGTPSVGYGEIGLHYDSTGIPYAMLSSGLSVPLANGIMLQEHNLAFEQYNNKYSTAFGASRLRFPKGTVSSSQEILRLMPSALWGNQSYTQAENGTYNFSGLTSADVTVTATATDVLDTDGKWTQHATTASAGNISGIITTAFTHFHSAEDFYWSGRFKCGSTWNNVRLHMGLFASAPTNSDTPPNNSVGVRYTNAGSLEAFVTFGATLYTQAFATATLAANTVFVIRIWRVENGFMFQRDDATPIYIGRPMGWASGTTLGTAIRIITTAANIRAFLISNMFIGHRPWRQKYEQIG